MTRDEKTRAKLLRLSVGAAAPRLRRGGRAAPPPLIVGRPSSRREDSGPFGQSIGGEKANGVALGEQAKLVGSDGKTMVVEDTGHWMMEERPQATMDALLNFL